MNTIEDYVEYNVQRQGDISEHLRTLQKYASLCEHVTELGVREVCSTWALLAGNPKNLNSFDIVPANGIENIVKSLADQAGIKWNFYVENVLTTDKICETDLLFIDTLHSYVQLSLELMLHGNKARKFIIFHDTFLFANRDEGQVEIGVLPHHLKEKALELQRSDKHGLVPALLEFLDKNQNWKVKEIFKNNNGLTVLERQA